jgi:hypothetical protein
MNFEDLLDTDQAAEKLRIKRQTLETWRMTGDGPVYLKLGRRVFYRLSALEAWIAKNARQSTSEAAT